MGPREWEVISGWGGGVVDGFSEGMDEKRIDLKD